MEISICRFWLRLSIYAAVRRIKMTSIEDPERGESDSDNGDKDDSSRLDSTRLCLWNDLNIELYLLIK